MSYDLNPFAADPTRAAIWDMLVRRDIDAYLARDFSLVEDDFLSERFLGISAAASPNPDSWTIGFPSLAAYRASWLAGTIDQADFAEPLRPAMFRVTQLSEIELTGYRGLAHKKFDGEIARADGTAMPMHWQSLYFLAHHEGSWKLTGFVGYLPNPMA